MVKTKSRHVRLTDVDRAFLRKIVRTGSHPAQQVRRSRILIELDENNPDLTGPVPYIETVAARAGVSPDTVRRVMIAYVDHDGEVAATITRKKRLRPPVEPKATGEVEARLIALSKTDPPAGYDRWSLRLLERHIVLTEGMPALDHSTIGRVLKKTRSGRT